MKTFFVIYFLVGVICEMSAEILILFFKKRKSTREMAFEKYPNGVPFLSAIGICAAWPLAIYWLSKWYKKRHSSTKRKLKLFRRRMKRTKRIK